MHGHWVCCMNSEQTWIMPYSRTETAMITAPLGVKPSVVTPVRQRLYGRVSVLFFAVPYVSSASVFQCWCPRNRRKRPEHAQSDATANAVTLLVTD